MRIASMGPRPYGRGKDQRVISQRWKRHGLQWGLDLTVEESCAIRRKPSMPVWLQWGLDLTVEESPEQNGH